MDEEGTSEAGSIETEGRGQGGGTGQRDSWAAYFGVRTGRGRREREDPWDGLGGGLAAPRCSATVSRTGRCSSTWSLGSGVRSGRRHRSHWCVGRHRNQENG